MTTAPGTATSSHWASAANFAAALRGAVVVLAVGMLGVLGASVFAGREAAFGMAIATGLVLFFFTFGSLSLAAFIRALPAMALPLAMLTYTFQILVIGACALLINRSGLLDGTVDGGWLGVGMIVLTLLWLGVQVTTMARMRVPTYDLDRASSAPDGRVRHGGW